MALELRDPDILKSAFNTLPFKRNGFFEKNKLKNEMEVIIKNAREGEKAKQIFHDKILLDAFFESVEEILESQRLVVNQKIWTCW